MALSMKVAFVGPSIWGSGYRSSAIDLRPPAMQGDIARAVSDGATTIGLVDGVFGDSAAVWHKEILHALAAGVTVYGASSMGALRAAELNSFGMIPVGAIAQAYVDGTLDDDAAVALIVAPGELEHMPLSEPLVDVWATIDALVSGKLISDVEARLLIEAAESIFFQDRTMATIVARAIGAGARPTLLGDYEKNRVFLKREDALKLLAIMEEPVPPRPMPAWQLAASPFWDRVRLKATHV